MSAGVNGNVLRMSYSRDILGRAADKRVILPRRTLLFPLSSSLVLYGSISVPGYAAVLLSNIFYYCPSPPPTVSPIGGDESAAAAAILGAATSASCLSPDR